MNEVWFDTDYQPHTYEPLKKGMVRINYYRTDGQYDKKSLWLWGDVQNPSKNWEIKFVYNPELGFSEIYLNGKNIETDIRGIEIANWVSEVAKQPEVRTYLVDLQRKMGKDKGIVMDGRDIGTTVFPEAELKIFMTASEQVRAQRRHKELQAKGDNASFDEVLANIQHRDHIDTTRKESPLKKADDAIVIDNTNLTIEEQVEKILAMVKS